MSRRAHDHFGIRFRPLAVALIFLAIAATDSTTLLRRGLRPEHVSTTTIARAQDDPLKALSDEYAQLESQGLKENFHRQLSFTMLQPYLPPGTRLTSGYRSPEKQLDLIVRMARARGIQTSSSPTLENEGSWMSALMALRGQGIIIAAPTTTPHGTDEAVFDLSGADLNSIRAGLLRAEQAGMVKYKRIIFEPKNNAVHVEVESISPKALLVLGQRRSSSTGSSSSSSSSSSETVSATPSQDEQRRRMLQQLQDMHDSEPDPAKKIDYDRSKRNLLDPSADASTINALDAEIEQHQKASEQLGNEGGKREAIARVSTALREGRISDAEREAEKFVEEFPNTKEAKSILNQITARRLVNEARDALENWDCEQCAEADRLVTSALELSPNHRGAKTVREDVQACLSRCKAKPFLGILVGAFIIIFVVSLGGLFFLSRPGNWLSSRVGGAHKWVLEGVEGEGRGQIFPLDKKQIVIGSQGPPNGVADIVISDAQRKISRRHCSITQNGKQFSLTDESSNGTKINGYDVPKGIAAGLRPGDRITLGDVAVLLLRPK